MAEVDEGATLLDVELDERADPRQGLVVAPEVGRVVAGPAHRLGHGHPVEVAEPAGAVGAEGPGDDPRAGAGHAEAGALLVREVDDAHGALGMKAVLAQPVNGGERPDNPQRAVEGAAAGHRVQVGADDHARVTVGHGRVRVAPPAPLVPHPVGHEVQAPGGALPREPLPQVMVLAGPGEPGVAPTPLVHPEGLEVVPHPPERRSGPAVSWRDGHGSI